MKTSNNLLALILSLLALAAGARSVQAQNPITFDFTGVITSVDDALGWFQDTYEVGATVTGSYTFFDSNYLTAVDALDPDHSVTYQYYFKPNFPGVPLTNPDFRLKAGDREIRKDTSPLGYDHFWIPTWNDSVQSFPGAGDGYGVTSAIGFPSFWRDFSGDPVVDPDYFFYPLPVANLRLHDPTGTALNSVALPLMPPDLAAFSERIGSISISDGNGEPDYATAQFQITSFFAQGSSGTLLTTFINPSLGDNFGNSVAAVGTDRIILGANTAGAAYLFDTSGMLLTTFTNPTPAASDGFGWSVAAMGSNQVLIGTPYDNTAAPGSGAAYLFSHNGDLLRTFLNPTSGREEGFGNSVAAVEGDLVLIGAYEVDAGVQDAGAAYLFNTNGTLLTTFTNPTPTLGAGFGWTLTGVGSDRVLIGARGVGTSYLFGTNGTLLTTITNPTPTTVYYFSLSVAAVGADLLLISSPGSSTDSRAAYLFNTNGALLTTFTNAGPAADYYEVAAMGSDRVVIATPQQTYLFSTNGALLTTITPSFQGITAVAAVGSDRVIIASMSDGAAALFALSNPSLSISRSNALITVSWPMFPGFKLQQNTNLSTANWTAPLESVTDDGTNHFILVNPPTGNRFYRLWKP